MVDGISQETADTYQHQEDPDTVIPSPNIQRDDKVPLSYHDKPSSQSKCVIPVRFNLMILGCLAGLIAYCLRFDLSFALVLMVNQTSSGNSNGHNHSQGSYCHFNETILTNQTSTSGEVDWDSKKQGIVTSAFFMGYFLSQVPCGILSQRIGGKKTVGFGLLVNAVLTFIFPTVSKYGYIVPAIIRGLMGIAQGSVFPGLILLQGKWVPVCERSKFNTVIGAGGLVGLILSTYSTSLLSSPAFGGWETPFYIFGGVTFLWFIFWQVFIFDDPSEHPRISAEELHYIQQSLKTVKSYKGDIPWRKILRYSPLWAVNTMLFSSSWLFYSVASFLPTYMKNILGLNIHQNGLFSSAPYIAAIFMSVTSGLLADLMLNKGVNITAVRKGFAMIGLSIESMCMLSVVYLGCNKTYIETMLIVAYGFGSFSDGGTSVTIIDIAPKYAGFIYGIANSVANLSGVLGPYVTGSILTNESSLKEWQKAFCVGCGINVLGLLIFLCFGSAKKAPWAEDIRDDTINTDPSDIKKHTNYGTIVT